MPSKGKIKVDEIEYTALFVESPDKLLQMFPPQHPKVYGHHSTNWYKPTSMEDMEIGKKSMLKIIGMASDENAFAVLVENPKSRKVFPHVTISCKETLSPSYSDVLLEIASKDGSLVIFKNPFFIEVIEGYCDLNDNIILAER